MTVEILTADQWYAKIKAMVPGWLFQTEVTIKAQFEGMGAVASSLQSVLSAHVTGTFILQSAKGTLDTHGYERTIPRFPGELDAVYAVRVQNLFNKSDNTDLAALVDQLLDTGVCTIFEDFKDAAYANRQVTFCKRGVLLIYPHITNVFTVVVHPQVSATVYTNIVNAVQSSKAMGTMFRVVQLSH